MSSSHWLFIIHSPHLPLFYFLNVSDEAHSPIQGAVLKPLSYARVVRVQYLIDHSVLLTLLIWHWIRIISRLNFTFKVGLMVQWLHCPQHLVTASHTPVWWVVRGESHIPAQSYQGGKYSLISSLLSYLFSLLSYFYFLLPYCKCNYFFYFLFSLLYYFFYIILYPLYFSIILFLLSITSLYIILFLLLFSLLSYFFYYLTSFLYYSFFKAYNTEFPCFYIWQYLTYSPPHLTYY
jgi:hypothetical protein